MTALKLKSIYLRNWTRVKEARLEFPEKGLVAVVGLNTLFTGKLSSVGVGKTCLGEAITRTLLGVDGRYSQLGWYSLDEAGNTYVEVEAELGGELLRVEMGYCCKELSKTGAGLRWRLGDRPPVERGNIRDTRAELSALLVSPLLAQWSVYLDGEKLKFNRLSQDEAVQLLMDSLDQPPWSKYEKLAKKRLDASATAQEVADSQHRHALERAQQLASSLDGLKKAVVAAKESYSRALARRQAALEAVETEKHRLEGLLVENASKRKALAAELKGAVESSDATFKQLELKVLRLKSRIVEGNKTQQAWEDVVGQLRREQREHTRELAELRAIPDSCPTCGKAWDRRLGPEELATKQQVLDDTTAQLAEATTSLEGAEKYVKERREEFAEATRAQINHESKQVERISRQVEALEVERGRHQGTLNNLVVNIPPEPDQSDVKVAEARLADCQDRIVVAEADLQAAAEAKIAAQRQDALSRYWYRGFGPSGIPNLVLRHAVRPLNDAAEVISGAISGGAVSVEFSTTSELVSGETRPKLSARAKTQFGATRLDGNSKGEAGLVNLIAAEAQTMVGSVFKRIGYRWLDEAVNTQDPLVRRQVYEYLRRQADEQDLLTFVVDHHPEARNAANYTLLAEKGADGFTRYRWA